VGLSFIPGIMAQYRLVTFWRIEAPLHQVYDAVSESLHWPHWWEGAEHVEQLDEGKDGGIGSVRRYTWKSRLAYKISFDAHATRIEPLAALEANVKGDLEGTGTWRFSHDKGLTIVCYEWQVRTTKQWMNLLAPIARYLFEQNHHALMQNGAEGLARLLGARLVDVTHRALPAGSGNRCEVHRVQTAHPTHPAHSRNAVRGYSMDLMTAIVSGVGAGIIATAVQLTLWWAFALPLPDILFRDARLAAAIVMGRAVLPPPATFEWNVMLAATVVHFALSVCYGLILAPLLSRLDLSRALLAGLLFGLLLYAANMYGFTAIFPWFEASRDWITAAAHVAFGMAAAGIYALRQRNDRPVRNRCAQ
jgi:uncharacterized protein YndB with AHSA1/START domain